MGSFCRANAQCEAKVIRQAIIISWIFLYGNTFLVFHFF